MIHVVVYRDTLPERLERIVEVHCDGYHPSVCEYVKELVYACIEHNKHSIEVNGIEHIRIDII